MINAPKGKEFLYIGHYIDTKGRYILKIGTTNNLKRRRIEHTKDYRHNLDYVLPQNQEFIYDWFLPMSKYNTIRFEDQIKEHLKQIGIGQYIYHDRFNCGSRKPPSLTITIRKEYHIEL